MTTAAYCAQEGAALGGLHLIDGHSDYSKLLADLFQILAGYRSKRHLAPIIFTLLYPLMRGRSFKWFKYIKLRAIRTRPKNSGNKMEGKGIVKGVSRMDGWNFFMKNAAHNLLMVRRWGNGTKKFYALQEKKKSVEKSEDEKLWQIGGGVCCYTLKGERSLPPKREKRREGIWSLTRGDLSCNILENGAALERRSPHTKIISARPTIFSTCKKKEKLQLAGYKPYFVCSGRHHPRH